MLINFDINGLAYHVDIWGSAHKQTEPAAMGNIPLVLLHGFTGNAGSWRKLKPHFERYSDVLAIDIVGHGKTGAPADISRYTITSAARDIDWILEKAGIEKANILGYSMGGRLALTFALTYPNKVGKLILESASPGLEEEDQRAARRIQDDKLAVRIQEDGIPSFINFWENIPLFDTQKRLAENIQAEIRKQRLANSQIGLINSLKGMGTGSQPSWWKRLNELNMPVLLLTGSLDEKFCQIADRMHGKMKNASRITISDCGHAIHVEKPKMFGTIVNEFLSNDKGQTSSHL
ncbi:2-succinyl-6-hydroxy-2,4-cyclohexadiene-1-carboxylate synthase [Cytobacillus praedii]|uniref:2-succinyl-6-hydroxy-2, 4-cyclohexadiene-1-carboxylate synthase n=1 Tax=Cytobacillus praedii TaxID=1742358 RepID=UPI003F7DE12D